MFLNIIDALIIAQEGAGNGEEPASFLPMILMVGMLFAVMYFFMIRPQSKKQKVLDSMRSELAKNDKVMTTGGLIGIVAKIKDNEVILKIDESNNTRVTVVKGAIVHVIDKTETKEETEESADDSKE